MVRSRKAATEEGASRQQPPLETFTCNHLYVLVPKVICKVFNAVLKDYGVQEQRRYIVEHDTVVRKVRDYADAVRNGFPLVFQHRLKLMF